MPTPGARGIVALVGAVFAVGIYLAAPGPAFACSCIGPQPMAALASDPHNVIFTGVVQPLDDRGSPVVVTRWFAGPGAAAVVWIDPSSFGNDGASCGIAPLPVGAEWIFVAWRQETGELIVNLCSPHAVLAEPDGEAMLADAIATFGGGVAPSPSPSDPPTPVPVSGDDPTIPILIIAFGGGLLVLGGVILVMSRTRRPTEP